MEITIRRIEHILDGSVALLDKFKFNAWNDAFDYLEGRLQTRLSASQREKIMSHEDTQTNPRRELVNAAGVAYTAQVSYEIERGTYGKPI
jgi:hypothetical protein